MASTLPLTQGAGQPPLAPRWHTAVFVGFVLAVAITGTVLGLTGGAAAPAAPPSPWIMLAAQGMMVLYVVRVGRTGWALLPLLGRGWNSVGRALTDVAIACLGLFAIVGLERLLSGPTANHGTPLPVAVGLAVGVSEEIVYRGYLQTQLAAFTRRPLVAVAAQALLFGIAHGDRGIAAVLRIALYGAILGLVALGRRSLVPGILAHASLDVFGG